MMRLYFTILLTILLMLALAACQTATQTAAPTETIANTATPTQAAEQPTEAPQAEPTPEAEEPSSGELAATAYPGGEVNIIPTEGPTPAAGMDANYPAPEGEGPGAMPAVENRSLVTARLVDQAVDETNAEYTRLTVEVLNSAPFDSMPEFTSDLVGQSVDFLVLTTDLPQLNPGDTFEAEVTFRGDEFGGEFFASELMKAP